MTGERSEPDSRRVSVLDQTLWKRMAEGETLQATLESWLAIQCNMTRSATQGVLVLGQNNSDVSFAPAAVWPEKSVTSRFLAGTAELVVAKGSGIIRRGETGSVDSGISCIAYPLKMGPDFLGVIAIQLDDCHSPDLKQSMRHLQLGAGWFEALTRREKAKLHSGMEEREGLALKLIAEILSESDFNACCMSVVNELAATLRCERATLGFLHKQSVKVAALSHTVQLDSKLNLSNAIASAMDEALDQGSIIVEPAIDAAGTGLVTRAQQILIAEHHSGAVVTVPFQWRDEPAGAFTFEKGRGDSFSSMEVALCESVSQQLGPLLEDRRRENRWLGTKIAEKFRTYLQKVLGDGHPALKAATAATLLLTGFFLFATGDYRVAAPALLKGDVQRVIAAPYDGYVAEAKFRAGDLVKKGEVIAFLDDRELMLERVRWSTQRRQHMLEYDQALSQQKRSEVGVIRARISQAEAQIELIDAQLSRSRLRAPFDGVLVSGDLSQSIGGVVRKGDTLFELVPFDEFRVVLNVDESDIRYIQEGQEGALVLTALPEANLLLTVTKIGPVSSSMEGANYFEIEAKLMSHDGLALRPGMEGIAKITTPKQNLFWIWTHRFFDWVSFQLWSMWP